MTNTIYLVVAEKPDGMTLIPEAIAKEAEENMIRPFNYKQSIPDTSDYEVVELPSLAKITTYLKQKKATSGKRDYLWDRLVFEKFLIRGTWLEQAMKLTGTTQVMFKPLKALILTGNGYTVAIMPIRPNDGEVPAPTDFDNI